MYIGPWQEYKLSQARRPLSGLATNNIDIRNDLQKTLLQTLAPEDVAKVMAAMNPLLNAQSGGGEASVDQTVLPPLHTIRRHQIRRPRRPVENAQPTLHEQFKLPTVNNQYRTDASSPGQNGTPQSVRSSKSEPHRSSRVIQRARNGIRAFSPPISAKSTGCDPSNLVATLKLERRSRPTLNDTAKKTDFGQFWGWKMSDGACKKGSETDSMGTNNKKNEDTIESKIEKVKNMHKLYSSGKPDQYVPPPLEPITVGVSASPLRAYKKPRTPIIEDRDLTSSDIAVISKYFTSNRSSSGMFDGHNLGGPHRMMKSPQKAASVVPSEVSSSACGDEDDILAANDNDSKQRYHGDENSPRIICSPVNVMNNPIGGNFSSPDGLLHWTAMLNPDEIDSMY